MNPKVSFTGFKVYNLKDSSKRIFPKILVAILL